MMSNSRMRCLSVSTLNDSPFTTKERSGGLLTLGHSKVQGHRSGRRCCLQANGRSYGGWRLVMGQALSRRPVRRCSV